MPFWLPRMLVPAESVCLPPLISYFKLQPPPNPCLTFLHSVHHHLPLILFIIYCPLELFCLGMVATAHMRLFKCRRKFITMK